jgi:pyrroloquinoline quinone (PQQ) biosynthesis protein C
VDIIERLDAVVDDFNRRCRYFNTPMTRERAQMFVRQHRLNTRQRNSVHKLAVATNCPIWEIRMRIIGASAQELIADNEFGEGKAHWEILEDLGVAIGMDRDDIRASGPLPSTQLCWLAWETLTKNRHWLEGLMANTCAERSNVPGYGNGRQREVGWSGVQRDQWRALYGLNDDQLAFWSIHSEADIDHSNLGWQTVAKYAEELNMADTVIEACRINLIVWENYFNGIGDAADVLAAQRPLATAS